MLDNVVVVIGAGGIGVAIARRLGFGKTVFLADFEPTGARYGGRGNADGRLSG